MRRHRFRKKPKRMIVEIGRHDGWLMVAVVPAGARHRPIPPTALRYEGRIYVLTDERGRGLNRMLHRYRHIGRIRGARIAQMRDA